MQTFKREFQRTWAVLLVCTVFHAYATLKAQNLIEGGSMENQTGWTIYNLGSATPASYTFNYSISKPAYGQGGCVRVTSPVKTSILFWQKITLKAGRKYTVDAAVKTNMVVSFWLELFLSSIAPTEGVDYQPTGGLVLGLSTWKFCGPNMDGWMSDIACNGNRSITPAGTADQDVEMYFAIKTGSMSTAFPNAMEVLIDEAKVIEMDDSKLLSSVEGTLDQTNLQVTAVTPAIKLAQLRSGLRGWSSSTINIIGKKSNAAFRLTQLDSVMVTDTALIQVTGNYGTNNYGITVGSLSSANNIISTTIGTLDAVNMVVSAVPDNVTAAQLLSALTLSGKASARILWNGNPVSNTTAVTPAMNIQVTAGDGTTKAYTLATTSSMIVVNAANLVATVASISNTIYTISGNSAIHITAPTDPLPGSMLNLTSPDVWLYFDNVRPQVVYDKYLKQILINGNPSVAGTNMRLVQYLQGTVLISQPSTYTALEVFSGDNLTGTPMQCGNYTYYRPTALGAMNDKIRSFKLKKGYMATFARDSLGTGMSRVYIADNNDLTINQLPTGLYDAVSFVRVIPWRWVAKKGWCGTGDASPIAAAEALKCSWRYNWDAGSTSTFNIEYVPIKQKADWPSYDLLMNKTNSPNALGFNEPDHTDQSNLTVAAALALWPNMLKSGLRLGSPAPSDGAYSWVYAFVDSCDKHQYRVDFVAVHFYRCGNTASQLYSTLKAIHDRTKRPIWITEWNNGANWTTCADPTYESQASTVKDFITMMDTTSFIERYSLYEWVEDTRHLFYKSPDILTPAGEVYRDKVSPMSFNPNMVYYPPFTFSSELLLPATTPFPADGAVGVSTNTVMSWTTGNLSSEINTTGHKVFFGTTSEPNLQVTATTNTYNPGTLLKGQTYYWQIKEVTAVGEKAGPIWKFTTEVASAPPSGIKELSGSNIRLSVYPNPVRSFITVTGVERNQKIDIFNLLGVKLRTIPSCIETDVSGLPKGMYFLKANGHLSSGFMKE